MSELAPWTVGTYFWDRQTGRRYCIRYGQYGYEAVRDDGSKVQTATLRGLYDWFKDKHNDSTITVSATDPALDGVYGYWTDERLSDTARYISVLTQALTAGDNVYYAGSSTPQSPNRYRFSSPFDSPDNGREQLESEGSLGSERSGTDTDDTDRDQGTEDS